jgi:hypothetical protein
MCAGLLSLCTLSCLLAAISYQDSEDSDNKETAFIPTISIFQD